MEKVEIIQGLENGLTRLREIAKVDPKILQHPYAPDKWNGIQVFSHVADTDLVMYVRFLRVLSEEGTRLVPFDQDLWVARLGGDTRPLELSLTAMESARRGFIYYLQSLPDEDLNRKGFHPERGELRALDIAGRASVHGLHHLDQLEAIRKGSNWYPDK
jgi:hypothetical protein